MATPLRTASRVLEIGTTRSGIRASAVWMKTAISSARGEASAARIMRGRARTALTRFSQRAAMFASVSTMRVYSSPTRSPSSERSRTKREGCGISCHLPNDPKERKTMGSAPSSPT
jgi:hypothetical protein